MSLSLSLLAISVPEFDGECPDWPLFQDLFVEFVYSTRLTPRHLKIGL